MPAAAIRLAPTTRATIGAALRRASRPGEDPLLDLLRFERPVPRAAADAAIPAALLADLVALHLVQPTDAEVAPRARLDPVGELLVASDLHRHRRAPDFVVGPGPASLLLARHVRPHARGRALDLGAGCGIQGLLLGDRATNVDAIDINPRAVAYATFNAVLNGRPRRHARVGDFLGEAPDRRLDGHYETVVANPPFVLAPESALVYRDRPLPEDTVGARTVERVVRALAPRGRGYVLCNWIGREPGSGDHADRWLEPVRRWVDGLGCDVVVVRVADLDPVGYAAVWTRDLPRDARAAAAERWAAALAAEGVRRIHVGVIALARARRSGAGVARIIGLDGRTERVAWQAVEAAFEPGSDPGTHRRG